MAAGGDDQGSISSGAPDLPRRGRCGEHAANRADQSVRDGDRDDGHLPLGLLDRHADATSAGLSYNLWAGTAAGTPNVMAPMANLSQRLPRAWRRPATSDRTTQWTLPRSAFAGGVVHWGVQAVDQAFAGSAFTTGPAGTPGCR